MRRGHQSEVTEVESEALGRVGNGGRWKYNKRCRTAADVSVSGPVTPSHSRLSPVPLSVVCVDYMMCVDT